jgi:transposase
MITVGVDAHKTMHVGVALDEAGKVVSEWTGGNTVAEWGRYHDWLVGLGDERAVGIEGAGSYGYGLARALVAAGERVYEVNSRLTALGRRHARRRGKSDSLDAEAVAEAVRREGERLPRVVHDEEASILTHLAEEREGLLGEATRVRNRLHAVLLQVDPEYKAKAPSLRSKRVVAQLREYEAGNEMTALERELVASVRRQATRLGTLMAAIAELGEQIEARAARYAPLTEIRGISHLSAGTLAGILGSHAPFQSDAQLASFAGVAPLEASSAGNGRHRLSRSGNRRLNAIIYRIAVAQLRYAGEARTYVEKKMREGHSKREAIRALKRYIVRAIWQKWKLCNRPGAPKTSFACL